MKIIAGCIIEKDNKILMVKEAKKKCYGQWNFPAGHLEGNETVTNCHQLKLKSKDGFSNKRWQCC